MVQGPAPADLVVEPHHAPAWRVPKASPPQGDKRAPLRTALERHGFLGPKQLAGRNFPMGCVALEITQRCNLDCTLCYLSENAEVTLDPPLEEVFRRIDMIAEHYGPLVTVQVTGGDPTLRDADDLVAIVERLRAKGLRSALFTNGIKATRPLMTRLAKAGLTDVSLHVDMTQERKGYDSELALNAVRAEYLDRVRGLGINVIFNTTVFDANLADIPALVEWFKSRADEIHMVSFNLEAQTGRGTQGGTAVDIPAVITAVNQAMGVGLDFDTPNLGHPECNRYSSVLIAGGRVTPIFDTEPKLFERLFRHFAHLRPDRRSWASMWGVVGQGFLTKPVAAVSMLPGLIRLGLRLAPGYVRSGRRMTKLSFYIHNFMDAQALEPARCEACIFQVMTHQGPISMCVHNADRDHFVRAAYDTSEGRFDPRADATLSLKSAKGKTRRQLLEGRRRVQAAE
ncbi:MAG: radical SAM protein [Maricaulaceae bacterium]